MTSTCPNPDVLRGLLDTSLPEPVQAEVVAHLDQCSSCQVALEQIKSGLDEHDDERANAREQGARNDEQVVGAVHEQEAQMAPAVPEARELRFAFAGVILNRDLADGEVLLRRADDHLGRELHAGRPQVEP